MVVAACLGAGVVLAPALSRAEAEAAAKVPLAAELSYSRASGAESCPDEAALRRAVVARLGEDPFSSAPAQQFQVEVSVAGDRFVGHITLVTAAGERSGQREFESSRDCTELVSALALAISLALNPSLAEVEQPDAGDNAPKSAPPPSETPIVAEPPPATPAKPSSASIESSPAEAGDDERPESSVRPFEGMLDTGLVGIGAAGVGPSPNFAGLLALRLRGKGPFSVNLEARADAPSSTSIPSGGTVKTHLYSGALAPCWHVSFASGCAVVLLGAFHAETRGANAAGADRAFYAALGGRLAVEHQFFPRLTFEIRGEVLGTLTPLTVWRNTDTKVWSTPPLSVGLGIGVLAQIL